MVRRKSVVRVPERSRLSPADQLAIALFCLAGVITLILYVVEKSPSSVCLCSAGIAALLIYPILHFIRDHRMRVAAFVVTFILSVAIAYASWPNVQTQPDTPVTSGNFKEVVTGLLVRFPARVVDVPDDRPGTTHLTAWTVNGRKFDLYYSPSVAEDKMAVGLEFPIPQEVLTAQNNLSTEAKIQYSAEFNLELTRAGAHCYSSNQVTFVCTDSMDLKDVDEKSLTDCMEQIEKWHNLCILSMEHLFNIDLSRYI